MLQASEYRLEDIDYRSSEDCPAVLLHKQLSHPTLAPLLVHGSRLKPVSNHLMPLCHCNVVLLPICGVSLCHHFRCTL